MPPPVEAELPDGTAIELRPLAAEICRRYRLEFGDELARYGEAGGDWCVHDNQHILNWALLDHSFEGILVSQIAWLADVLEARSFPKERLVRDLELVGDVLGERLPDATGTLTALRSARDSLS